MVVGSIQTRYFTNPKLLLMSLPYELQVYDLLIIKNLLNYLIPNFVCPEAICSKVYVISGSLLSRT